MRRRLFNLAVVISLAVCVAICVIWVRSFYVIENRTIVTAGATYEIGSGGGALAVQRVEGGDGQVRWMRPRARFSVLGVEMIEGRLNRRRPWTLLLMPYWVPGGNFRDPPDGVDPRTGQARGERRAAPVSKLRTRSG